MSEAVGYIHQPGTGFPVEATPGTEADFDTAQDAAQWLLQVWPNDLSEEHEPGVHSHYLSIIERGEAPEPVLIAFTELAVAAELASRTGEPQYTWRTQSGFFLWLALNVRRAGSLYSAETVHQIEEQLAPLLPEHERRADSSSSDVTQPRLVASAPMDFRPLGRS